VADECPGVEVPDYRDTITFQILLRGFRGTPVGGEPGEFAHDQRFDERPLRFLIVDICTNVADVRISEADDLAGIARIAENFLVSGEAGIKNNFSAAPRAGASGAPVKNSSVLERENGRAYPCFRQRFLQERS
jgi:hypothetical protein